jgi:hypothetical protein
MQVSRDLCWFASGEKWASRTNSGFRLQFSSVRDWRMQMVCDLFCFARMGCSEMKQLLLVALPLQAWKELVIDTEVQAVPAVAMEDLMAAQCVAVPEEHRGPVALLEVERLAVPLVAAVVVWIYESQHRHWLILLRRLLDLEHRQHSNTMPLW